MIMSAVTSAYLLKWYPRDSIGGNGAKPVIRAIVLTCFLGQFELKIRSSIYPDSLTKLAYILLLLEILDFS